MRRSGFSLVELLVATAVLGIVSVYLMETFATTKRTYTVVEQVSEAQQNLRVVAELLERDLRLAGYLVPEHAAVCGVDSTSGSDSLFVSNADALRVQNDLFGVDPALLGGDLGASIAGIGPGSTIGGTGQNLVVTQRWLDVAADGTDFGVGSGVIVVDRNDEGGRAACGTVTGLVEGAAGFPSGATITVDFATATMGPLGSPLDLVAVPAHVYTIAAPDVANGIPSQLLRNGVLLANDVEDLQVEYFFDLDDDHVLDAGEYLGDLGQAVGDGVSVPYDATANNGREIRQVRISLVTATREDDPNPDGIMMPQQRMGNRAAGTVAAPDRRRRRAYTATVRLRNV